MQTRCHFVMVVDNKETNHVFFPDVSCVLWNCMKSKASILHELWFESTPNKSREIYF
jgi:hypothetical protein